MTSYYPEGYRGLPEEPLFRNVTAVREAMLADRVLTARAVVCNAAHDLIVDLGCMKGIIPREEGALGIREGTTRDVAILSRVNKPVCFKIVALRTDERFTPYAILSRRAVQLACQREYISALCPGDIIKGKVTHLEPFGCFVDIGCGIVALLPIDSISVSRISHPRDRFTVGQDILAVVKSVGVDGKICLSHKELLGSWAENAADFSVGETVAGMVRSVESYGIFIELSPNLAGLAECKPNVRAGQQAGVYIKSLIPEKMKVKLIVVDAFDAPATPPPLRYYLSEGHIDRFRYSPDCSDRVVETVFAG